MRPGLFPYQRGGAAYLSEKTEAILGDEMGLGKTPQAIAAADLRGARNIICVAPASVVEHWRREWIRWQTIPRPVRSGRGDVAAPGVRVVSYDALRQSAVRNPLLARRWDLLVADEAHYVKTPGAQRSRAVAQLVERADARWALTGTPVSGTADEIWNLLRLFGSSALQSDATRGWPDVRAYSNFRRRYCREIPLGNTGRSKIIGVKNPDELRARVLTVMLRRKKADVLRDLPPLLETEMIVAPGPAVREIGQALETDPALRGLIRHVMGMALLQDDVENSIMPLLRSADDSVSRLRAVTAAVKARALAPMLVDEMRSAEGRKLVVMGWHRAMLDTLDEALSPFGVARVDGQVPRGQRQAAIDAFQNDPRCRVFLGQIQAAGTGITLTAASDLIFAEMAWTPAQNAQAAMRVHRVGQTRPVTIRYATLAGTVDEAVVRTLRRKTQDIRSIIA